MNTNINSIAQKIIDATAPIIATKADDLFPNLKQYAVIAQGKSKNKKANILIIYHKGKVFSIVLQLDKMAISVVKIDK